MPIGIRPTQVIFLVCLASIALAACAQNAGVAATQYPPNGSTGATNGPVQAARVIVTFSQSVPFNDGVFLLELQSQVHASFGYVGSVSGLTHVYSVQPPPGELFPQVLQRLRSLRIVQSAEIDQKMKIQ